MVRRLNTRFSRANTLDLRFMLGAEFMSESIKPLYGFSH
jgi:hypothetical protein